MNEITQSPRATWQDYARKGQLAYQWSPDANRAVFYPRLACPFGGRATLEWRVSEGRGSVHAITLTTAADGSSYTVALIDLDEGFRMMSTVEGATGDPSETGRRVRLRFAGEDEHGTPVPAFEWDHTS